MSRFSPDGDYDDEAKGFKNKNISEGSEGGQGTCEVLVTLGGADGRNQGGIDDSRSQEGYYGQNHGGENGGRSHGGDDCGKANRGVDGGRIQGGTDG